MTKLTKSCQYLEVTIRMAGYYSDYHFLAKKFFLFIFYYRSKELVETIILVYILHIRKIRKIFFFNFWKVVSRHLATSGLTFFLELQSKNGCFHRTGNFIATGAQKKNFLKKTRISGIPKFFSKTFFSIFFFHFMATVGLALFERPPRIKKRL